MLSIFSDHVNMEMMIIEFVLLVLDFFFKVVYTIQVENQEATLNFSSI